ncbi:MAG: class I SAM-dependent methyltransferase [bacterium]
MKMWNDHFSGHADLYAKARPTYPPEVFAWLRSIAPDGEFALDVGTGNGQAAVMLAEHFTKVVACDPSEPQIKQARHHDHVTFVVAPAEELPVDDASVSLILAAQAAHWFDLPRFFDECRRVLKPGGVLALLSYGVHHVTPAVDEPVGVLYHQILEADWPAERALVESGYAGIELPFGDVPDIPAFEIAMEWPVERLLDYLRSWSATQRHAARTLQDPVSVVEHEIRDAFGRGTRPVVWPINVRVAKRDALC